jgi:signal peptidase I
MRTRAWKVTALAVVLGVVLPLTSAGAATATHPTYALGSAANCKAHYVEKILKHTVEGKTIQYIGCVYVAPTNPQPDDYAFSVPSTSMAPTLEAGDLIVVDEQPRDFLPIREGEIVVLSRPAADTECGSGETDLVERVIGLPGQNISSRGNTVYINNNPLNEPYLPRLDPLGPKGIGQETIPKNEFFVMGDNRAISCDSRYWGTISSSLIIGKVVLACSMNESNRCKSFG